MATTIDGRKFADPNAIATDYVAADPIIRKLPNHWLPFQKLVQKVSVTPNPSMEIDFVVGDDIPLTVDVSSYGANTVTVAKASDINGFYPGMEIYDKVNNHYWIIDVVNDSGPTFDMYSVSGSGTPSGGDTLIVSSASQGEAGKIGTPTYDYTTKQNYVQSIAMQIEKSDFYSLADMRVDDWGYQTKKAFKNYSKMQELALLIGENTTYSASSASNEPSYGKHYLTGGLKYWIDNEEQNEDMPLANLVGTAGMDAWKDFEQDAFLNGDHDEIWGFCGLGFYRELHDLYDNVKDVQFTPEGPKEFKLFAVRTFLGVTLHLLVHPAFKGPLNYYAQFFNPQEVEIGEAMPHGVRKVEMGERDMEAWKYKRVIGLKPRTLGALWSLELTT